MITLEYEEDFLKQYQQEPRKILVYGIGSAFKEYANMLPVMDILCDRNAERIGQYDGKKVLKLEDIQPICEPYYCVIFIAKTDVFREVCANLEIKFKDAIFVNGCNNISFGYTYYKTAVTYKRNYIERKMRVNIVCEENEWIFRKFATKLAENLSQNNVQVSISNTTREDVDINHHIPWIAYSPYKNDTLMITHVDDMKKVLLLKKQLEIASMGICMSKETRDKLISYGVNPSKLCYINPAHDNEFKPQKVKIGITHRCYDGQDLRKRATSVLDIISCIDNRLFKFYIMGSGWDSVVTKMRENGFEVDYYDEFNRSIYEDIMNSIDYYFYMGFDEGSMGILDALAVGAGTIVTPQGYHLDTDCDIDYPCRTIKQFQNAFLDIQNKRLARIKSVQDWTWKAYAEKHLDIWKYILKMDELNSIYSKQLMYEDGIYSVLLSDCRI